MFIPFSKINKLPKKNTDKNICHFVQNKRIYFCIEENNNNTTYR